MDLYVYYKVPAANEASLRDAVMAMQAALSKAHGIAPQLKRRPQARDGLQTWMEVYPALAGDAFLPLLEAAAARAGLAQWTAGERHVEIFEDFPPCA